MDKYLKVEFFKKRGFESKEEGMGFIEQVPDLKRKLHEYTDDIEEYKSEKISKYSKTMDKYDNEKSVYMISAKKKRAEKRVEKELVKKQKREMLKNEIRMEMEIEVSEAEKIRLIQKYNKFCPDIDFLLLNSIESLYTTLFQHMEECSDNDSSQKSNLLKIKENIDNGYKMIEKSVIKLQSIV